MLRLCMRISMLTLTGSPWYVAACLYSFETLPLHCVGHIAAYFSYGGPGLYVSILQERVVHSWCLSWSSVSSLFFLKKLTSPPTPPFASPAISYFDCNCRFLICHLVFTELHSIAQWPKLIASVSVVKLPVVAFTSSSYRQRLLSVPGKEGSRSLKWLLLPKKQKQNKTYLW